MPLRLQLLAAVAGAALVVAVVAGHFVPQLEEDFEGGQATSRS